MGASVPSETLYQGDSFALYGYVRSSETINTLTGTIDNSDGTEVFQTVIVKSKVTDYNLNGGYNVNLNFGDLAIGSYRYEITASTEETMETIART